MLNPDPEKFYTLTEAFNVLGRERFHDEWSGTELKARDLPPPEETFHTVNEAARKAERERVEAVKKAERMSAGVKSGPPRPPRSIAPSEWERRKIERVARHAGVDPEIVRLTNDPSHYQEEYAARQRRDKMEAEIRRMHFDGAARAKLLDERGELIDISGRCWFAKNFAVSFATSEAAWTEAVGDTVVDYKGLVLTERVMFEQAIRNIPRSTASAVGDAGLETQAEETEEQDGLDTRTATINAERLPPKQGSAGGLSMDARSKGGSQSRHNPWLQKAIELTIGKLMKDGTPPTSSAVWGWLEENATSDARYEFDPPIPGCDELYVDGDILSFTDQAGNVQTRKRRSLDTYIAKAKAKAKTENPPKLTK